MKLRLDFYDNIVYIDKAILTANTFLINIITWERKKQNTFKTAKGHGAVLSRYFVRKVDIEFIDHMMALLSWNHRLVIFYKFHVFMAGKLSGLGVFQQKGSACLLSTSDTNNLTFRKLTVKKNKYIMSHSLDPPARYLHYPKNFTFWVHFRSQGRQFSWRVRRVR